MIELEYSPKLHIQALYRSISLVYYDSMSVRVKSRFKKCNFIRIY